MREDSFQYHRRVIDEFTKAVINKEDASEEAVNVLLSANNLENQGYTRVLLKNEAEEYLHSIKVKPATKRVFSSSRGDTLQEAAPHRHHVAIPQFNLEQLTDAIESGDDKKLDKYVRMYAGWRAEEMANPERGKDVVGKHSKIKAMHLFPGREGEVAYGSTPLFQQLTRFLFGGDADNAERLHKAMMKTAKGMHQTAKAQHLFSEWNGNANMMRFFNKGFNDFKSYYAKKYPQNHAFLNSKNLAVHYLRVKNWENEGIPRDEIMDVLFNEKGIPQQVGNDQSPVQLLRTLADQYNDTKRVPKNGEPNFGRVGLDAYRLGIAMLPYNDIYNIMKWMLVTNGGTREDGSIDDSFLTKRFGPDMRGYMAHHAYLMDNVIDTLHSGGSGKNGNSHTTPNKFTEESRNRVGREIKERSDKMRAELESGNWKGLEDYTLERALETFPMQQIVERFADEHNCNITDDGGDYPHIHRGEHGDEIYMQPELPNIPSLITHGFFQKEELDSLIGKTISSYGQEEYADLLRHSVRGYTHTHDTDEFDMLTEPVIQQTAKGIVMEGIGQRRGCLDGESGDIPNAYDGAFGDVIRSTPPERTFMTISRPEREATGSKKTQEQQNVFDPKKDADGQIRRDLARYLRQNNVANEEQLLAQYDAGEAVSLDVPRRNISLQESLEASGLSSDDPMQSVEDYLEGMPQRRTPATKGLHSFYMGHSDFHDSGDLEDFVGFFALDGKHKRGTRSVLETPMLGLRKERIRAQKKGSDRLFESRHLPGSYDKEKSEKMRQFGYNKGQLEHTDKLLTDILFHGSHLPLHEFDDDALQRYQDLLREDHKDRLGAIKQSPHHKDILGRSGDDLLQDILTDAEPPSQIAIYNKEDYEQYMLNRLNPNMEYQLPQAVVANINTRGRLLQELKGRDMQYLKAREEGDEQAMGERANELEQYIATKEFDSVNPVPISVLHQHGTEDEPAVSSLIVAPTPSYLGSAHQAELMQSIRIARKNGRNQLADTLQKRLRQVSQSLPPTDGGEVHFNNHEQRLRNEAQTTNAVNKIFKALRPALEKHFPNVFTEGNDKAYSAIAYTLKLAEQIAMLEPDTRERLFREGGITYGRDTIKFDLSEDEISDLKSLQVTRSVHQGSTNMAEKALDSQFGGVQPRGHEASLKLARADGSNVSDDDIAIFEGVINKVQEAANKQDGVNFEKAFMARYHPHAFNGAPVRGRIKRSLYDQFKEEGMKGKFQYNEGGLFHNLGQDQIMNGGESVIHNKKPVSMYREREAIVNVLRNAALATKAGSDISMDFKRLKRFGILEGAFTTKKMGKMMKFTDPSSLENIASLLHRQTGKTVRDESSQTDEQVTLGGSNFNNAPVTPNNTCREGKFHYGLEGTRSPPFVAQPQFLDKGRIVLETDDLHTINAPSPQMLRKNINQMRTVVPELKPLDLSQPLTYFNYEGFNAHLPNPNQRMGQGVGNTVDANEQATTANDPSFFTYSSHTLDVALDDTLIIKEDGKPQPIKFMHRIFGLEDMTHLRGFTGDWVLSLYPQGEHVIVTKDEKGMTAYGVDGEVKLDEAILEEKDKVYEKDFTVHAILHDGVMTVIDLLKTADEDTHNMPTKDRIRHLRAQYESSEHIKMPEPINTKRSDDEGLQTAIDGLQQENNIDILLRDANATYMKGEPRHPKWVLLSKEKMVDVIILSASGTSYTIGVGPLMHPENYGKRAQQVGSEHYMNVGSAKGPRGLKVGDFATVRCTGVSASKKEHPVYRIRSAKITDNEPFAADSVETLAIISGEHHVPQQVTMKKGKITIHFPSFEDEVICKTVKEDGLWRVEPQSSTWGNEYLVKLARDQEAYWEMKAAWLLMKDEEAEEEPEYEEVVPEPPAGHSKKRKKVLEEEEEVIKRGLELIERGLEHLSKEKITSTGVQGLGLDYATPDESPRGPTQNIRDNTMPDFDPQARADDELKPATAKKTKRLRTDEGETARLEDDGVIAIENSSIDIR